MFKTFYFKPSWIFCISLLLSYTKISAQCGVAPTNGSVTISIVNNIINSYYAGASSAAAGSTSLTVGAIDTRGNTTPIAAGDLVLIIQIQGADIGTNNDDSYGDNVTGGPGSGYLTSNLVAGNYEYNTVASVSGSVINFTYKLANSYYNRDFTATTSIQRYEVVRIPRYYDFKIKSGASVTCPAWNGSTGGIVGVDVDDKFTLSGTIDVSYKGFRGGGGKNLTGAITRNSNGAGPLTNTDYRWNSPITTAPNLTGGTKGEGIAGTPAYIFNYATTLTTTNSVEGYINGSMGRGAPGNAGGGGTDGDPVGSTTHNAYNSGGGGGANGGDGGNGGSGWHGATGDVNTYPTGGYGGIALAQRGIGKFSFGGGGGAGSANNSLVSNEYSCSGGSGGGIVLVRAKLYAGNGTVLANGSNAPGVTATYTPAQTDAAGGGGAGGSIVMVSTQTGLVGLDNITASAIGGNGGDMTNYYDYGPGGGGGGGVIITNGTFLAANVFAGDNGETRTDSITGNVDNDYGSTPGTNGDVIILPGPPSLKNALQPASPCGVLPVTLTDFSARWGNTNTVNLSWNVTNVVSLNSFELEYSKDGNEFVSLSSINYQTGQAGYGYAHITSLAKNFYRLKLVDANGEYFYSKILSVQKDALQSKTVLMYPNPAYSDLTLKLTTGNDEKVAINIFDNAGKIVNTKNITLPQGDNFVSIDGIAGLPAGFYFVKIKSTTLDAIEKLIISKN